MSDELIGLGRLIDQGRHDLAEPLLREFLAKDPSNSLGHAFVALCRIKRRAWKEAEPEIAEALRLGPDVAYIHHVRTRWFVMQNRLAESEAPARESIRLAPNDPDYHGQLAGILFDLGRTAEAQDSADAGLRHDPQHVVCSNLRALCLMRLDRGTEAGRLLDGSLRVNPENAWTHVNRGNLLVADGRFEKAGEHFQEALRLDPNSGQAREGLLNVRRALFPILGWPHRLRQKRGRRFAIGYVVVLLLVLAGLVVSEGRPAWHGAFAILLVVLVFGPWVAVYLSSVVLALHPRTRHLLRDGERIALRIFTGIVVLFGLMVGANLLFGEAAAAWVGAPVALGFLVWLIRSGAAKRP